MTFKVVETYWDIQNDGYYLVHSNWDDWFKYETTYLFYIKKNNGVAILATHSPIILQEVQKECVYKLSREMSTDFMQAVRPSNETFAEDIGSLTLFLLQKP
ncbi:TPA: hypothetical protein VLG99_001606 [Streptococcus pyogenes]|nr:hypothetical protein [Streptococcus pyogenes]